MIRGFIAFLFIFSVPAGGQEITTEAEAYVGSAESEARPQQKQQVADTYREMNSSLTESLQEMPAITVQQSSNQNQFVYLQGAASGQTGIYVDGLLWNDPSSPDQLADLFGLSSFSIQSISVFTGPQSGSWGPEGLSGVVHFESRPIDKSFSRMTMRAGNRGFLHLGLNSTTATPISGTLLNFETRSAKGFSSASEKLGNTEVDGYEAQTLFVKHRNRFRKVDVDSQFLVLQGRQDFDDRGGTGGDDPTYEVDKQLFSGGVHLKTGITSKYETGVKFQASSMLRDYNDVKDLPSDPVLEEKYVGDRQFVQWNLKERAGQSDLNFGADYSRESMRSKEESSDRNKTGYFIERADAALRADVYDQDQSTDVSGRFNPEFKIRENLFLMVGGSVGTRRPSLGQLFDPQYGNAALLPETVRYRQVGLRWNPQATTRVQWNWFHSDYENLVQWDFVTSKLSNVGRAKISGNEMIVSTNVGGTHIDLGFTVFGELRDVNQNSELLRRPKSKGTVGVERFLTDAWALSSQVQWVSQRSDVDPVSFSEVTLTEYWLVDMSVKWLFDKNSFMYVQLKNVLDTDYETASGYGSEPFGVYLGTQVQL